MRSRRWATPARACCSGFEQIVDAAIVTKKAEAAGQESLFDMFADALGDGDEAADAGALTDGVNCPHDEFGDQAILKLEREMLGLYVSDHPLSGTERLMEELADTTIGDLAEVGDRGRVRVGGVLTSMTKRYSSKGETYVRGTFEDLTGSVEVTVWPSVYRVAHEALYEDAILVVDARVEVRDEVVSLVANKITVPDLSEVRGAPLVVSLAAQQGSDEAITLLGQILDSHRGHVPVQVELTSPGMPARRFSLADTHRVLRRPGLYGELKSAFGPDCVREPGHREFEGERRERSWQRQ